MLRFGILLVQHLGIMGFIVNLDKRFKESRSRSLKNRVRRGLGQSLNKQKPVRSVKAEWMGFAHL